jgi:sugar phosphate isomerase/epimerase
VKRLLIIPELDNIEDDLELVDKYNLGFEYNDFFDPYILDNDKKISELKEKYSSNKLPNYTTMHAALSRTSLTDWAEKLGKYVKHVHINDNDQVSDLHLAWGKGVIDRNEFYKCYDKYMSDATILLETRGIENKVNSIKQLKEDGFMD